MVGSELIVRQAAKEDAQGLVSAALPIGRSVAAEADNQKVGNEEDLELLKSSIKRQHTGPSRVNTVIIQGADHMYAGQEDHVAQVIASWADTLLPANKKSEVPKTP